MKMTSNYHELFTTESHGLTQYFEIINIKLMKRIVNLLILVVYSVLFRGFCYNFLSAFSTITPMSAGLLQTIIPASESAFIFSAAVGQLSSREIGQSTCIGIGGDPIIGTRFIDALKLFKDDDETDAVVIIGEIGGTAEEEAAACFLPDLLPRS